MASTFDPYYKWLGIRPEEQPANHYRLLAVALFESDLDVIASAADQRMAHVRSFQSGAHSAESQKVLNEIAAARVCLLNPEKKAAYDETLRQAMAAVATPSEPLAVAAAPAAEFDFGQSDAVPVRASPANKRRSKVEPWQVSLIAVAVILLVGGAVALLTKRGMEPTAPTVAKTAIPSSADSSIGLKHRGGGDENAKSAKPARANDGSIRVTAATPPSPSPVGKDSPNDLRPAAPTTDVKASPASRSSSEAPEDGTSKPSRRLQGRYEVRYEHGYSRKLTFRGNQCVVESHKWDNQESPVSLQGEVSYQPDGSITIDFSSQQQYEVWRIGPSEITVEHWSAGADRSGPRSHVGRAELVHAEAATANAKAIVPSANDANAKESSQLPLGTNSHSPVPDADAQAKGMKLIKEVYGGEYEAAKTVDQKKALAKKLLEKANESREDAAAQYLLMKLAREVAVQGADADTAFEAIDKVAGVFQVDGLEMKIAVLSSISGKVRLAPEHRAIARRANELIDMVAVHSLMALFA